MRQTGGRKEEKEANLGGRAEWRKQGDVPSQLVYWLGWE